MRDPGNTIDPNDPVAAQYERWSYPAPIADLATVPFDQPGWHYRDLRELYWAYWPSEPWREDLDILVPGCGSVAAACYAYLYPQARVTGIDISAASLAHEERLKQQHNLANLTLHRLPIEQAHELGRDFDLAVSHGVLHHLADPVAGLAALRPLIRPHGVVALMVYARYGRAGVYMLQELFRLLDLRQDETGLQVVREALSALGPRHPVQSYLRMAADDIATAEGLVDTFLHRRDRPYTVPECLELATHAGFAFQGWDENILYYPDVHMPAGHPLHTRLAHLEGPALWQAVELIFGCHPGHFFHVCRSDRPEATYRLPFGTERFLDCRPVARANWGVRPEPLLRRPVTIARAPFPEVPLTSEQAAIFGAIDGERSVRDCVRSAGVDPDTPQAREFAHKFFTSLWRLGYVVLRLPGA